MATLPRRLPPVRAGRPLKRWRYAAVYSADVMLCAGHARVMGIPQRWWAVALPDGSLFEGARGVEVGERRVRVSGALELELDRAGTTPIEVTSPQGRSFIWTRKHAGVPVHGFVSVNGRRFEIDGDDGFMDESAGYHARHTAWRWSAGVGRAGDGRRVAWNLVDGIHDAETGSERAVWVDGEPHEVGPQEFAPDLSSVGGLRFAEWSAREHSLRRGPFRSSYRQPFGTFSGELPGGLRLAEGYGVMEEHDAYW